MRHSAVVISTMPDLFVSVKAAKGGDWPGSKVLVGELAAVEPEAMISNSGEREGNGGGGEGGGTQRSPGPMRLSVLAFTWFEGIGHHRGKEGQGIVCISRTPASISIEAFARLLLLPT